MKNIALFTVLLFILNSKALSAFRTLEADYITNVFSQSNFIKNPNARVNTQNVTASTGFTVTRAITTPLYDTSEFNLSSTSATGNVDWATRTFDAGMKGQNCEARFTYRGFTGGTTKAQIVQGANTVATLDLLASTDPKQVSINFPCGDLTQATSFRIARSVAAFSGANEIGGIYVGLATNMANVAQAEFVGQSGYGYTGDLSFSTSSTTYADLIAAQTISTQITENEGSASSVLPVSGVTPLETTISNPKAGNYFVTFSGVLRKDASTQIGNCAFRIAPVVNGVIQQGGADQGILYLSTTGNTEVASGGNPTISFQLNNSPSTLSFRLMARLTGAGSCRARIDQGGVNASRMKFIVHRFPLSSELVVKPQQQQPVWGSISVPSGFPYAVLSTSTYSPVNLDNSYALEAIVKGSGSVNEDSNTIGLDFNSLPVGTYFITASAKLIGSQSYTGNLPDSTTKCSYALGEYFSGDISKPNNSVYISQDADTSYKTSQLSWIYENKSVGRRIFALYGARASSTGYCGFADGRFEIKVQQIDGKNPSALYVQAPVLGAQTGAAIPSGYVGEAIASQTSLLTGQSQGSWKTGTGITLQPGVYLVDMKSRTTLVAATSIECGLAKTVNGSSINDDRSFPTSFVVTDQANTTNLKDCRSSGYFTVTSATTIYPTMIANAPTSSGYRFDYWISAVRIN